MKKVLSVLLAVLMLCSVMSVSAFAAAAATRRTVQITVPAELLEQLAKDGFKPSRVRLNKLDEASTRMAIFETDPAVVEIEIGPNELLCYQYIGETQFYEAIWFLTDDLIKAADGDGIVDVGAADRPYNFNPEVYFNGSHKATVKWVDGTTSSSASSSSSSSATPTPPPAGENTVLVAGTYRTPGQIQNASSGDYLYTVNYDDTLYDLSARFYGTGDLWKELQAANQEWLNETTDGMIFVGFNLLIPTELGGVQASIA